MKLCILVMPTFRNITGMQFAMDCFDQLENFILPIIKEHRQTFEPENIRDFLDLMIQQNNESIDPKSAFFGKTGEASILQSYVDLFLSGSETTTSSLLWAFLYLLHFPEWQKKIHEEIDTVIGLNRLPSFEDVSHMHLTNAFLLESLRLTSFIPMGAFHYNSETIHVTSQ